MQDVDDADTGTITDTHVAAPPSRPSRSDRSTWIALGLALLPVILASYLISQFSYLLFHAMVEMAFAVVAAAVFLVTWHSRRFLDNDYVGVIGTFFLPVAAVGILHTLAYKGMGAFPSGGTDLPTQLWLVSRYLTAAAFVAAPFSIRRRVDLRVVLGISVSAAVLLVGAVLLGLFPHAFIEGQGLTPFKIGSEYVVVALLAFAAVMLYRERSAFDGGVFRLLMGAILASIGAELAFTLYQDPYGASNLSGHVLLAGSAFLVYQALVRIALEDPYSVLFRRLKQREETAAATAAFSQALNRAAEEIGSTLDFDEIMRRVVIVAAESMGADAMAISMTCSDGWVIRHVYGYGPEMVDRPVSLREGRHMTESIARRDIITVEDVEKSDVVHRPFFESLGMRAFATVPLVARDEAIGVMSFHFRSPHRFSELERDFARKLAASIALGIENARLYATEHEIAETLQEGLTSALQSVPGVEVGCEYLPSPGLGRIGGDFFDVFPVGESHVVFLIGDVAGKGFRAASTTAVVRGAARALAHLDPSPTTVFAGLNDSLAGRDPEGSFVTLLYGVLDTATGRVRVAVAGHPLPWLSQDCRIPELEPIVGPPLGLFPDRTYLSAEFNMRPGNTLVMFTDGVIDARADGSPLGEEGAGRIICENAGLRPGALAAALARAARDYAHGSLIDDMAVLVVVYAGI